MATMWTLLAIETGSAFAVTATLAMWARRGFPRPARRGAAK